MSNIEHMVNRFLAWKLPVDFYPDGGISFNREGRNHTGYQHEWPVGTNLLTAEQAKAMFEYVLDGAQQPQYEAGDMASAAAQGFRDGVASVAQQPQAEAVATVIEELEHDGQGWCAKVRWLFNPVPVGEMLLWRHQK